jgi:AcrR family transcriptional regulator
MASKRQAARDHTRAKVLGCARDLFATHGFDAVTIRDLARAVGMSTGAIFANFKDKEAVFEAAFDRKAPHRRLKEFLAYLAEHDPSSIVDELRADLYGSESAR